MIEIVADIGEGVQPVATAAKVQVDRMGKEVHNCCLVKLAAMIILILTDSLSLSLSL